MSGAFVAVIGPSGAGKDSVIDSARALLDGQGFIFPRRLITRPVGSGEDHVPVSVDEFERIEAGGGFALSWRAHGLAYGVSIEVLDAVRRGGVVVVNVSRGVLSDVSVRFARSAVVRVTVPDELRRARISGRGREVDADVQARMDRIDPAPNCAVDLEIVNDRAIEDAGRAFADFLSAVRPLRSSEAVTSVGGFG